jgi:hypothetical protein
VKVVVGGPHEDKGPQESWEAEREVGGGEVPNVAVKRDKRLVRMQDVSELFGRISILHQSSGSLSSSC